jgi:formylglycine-generating enzyme required for sulfatase activity
MDQFEISVAPITNREFGQFIADGGYEQRDVWTNEGWTWRTGKYRISDVTSRWKTRRDSVAERPELPARLLQQGRASLVQAAAIRRFAEMTDAEITAAVTATARKTITQPAFWDDPRLSNPQQPVVGVSSHEADAYCRWLSTRHNRRFRLPTEDEWEIAALMALRSDETLRAIDEPIAVNDVLPETAWRVIWGNTAELHVNRPTPIGAFAVHARDTGVPVDMFGNVFEWTADNFQRGDESRRVCKGGSWRHVMRRAVPGYRGRGDLATRNDDDGFRIVAESH